MYKIYDIKIRRVPYKSLFLSVYLLIAPQWHRDEETLDPIYIYIYIDHVNNKQAANQKTPKTKGEKGRKINTGQSRTG